MATKIIVDTDIGTDVDDCMALLLACSSPEVELVGVTTGGGEARRRARLAVQLLRRFGQGDVPVYAGMSHRLLLYRPDHFGSYDGHGLSMQGVADTDYPAQHAVEYLLYMARECGPDLTLVAIGPLSNVGAAVALDAQLMSRFRELVIMGGAFWGERARQGEYNIACDPDAARIVLQLGIPTTFVGLDVTLQVVNGPQHMARLRAADTPITGLAYSLLADYQARLKRDSNHLHDPLALACAFEQRFVEFVEASVDVVTEEGEGRGSMPLLETGRPKCLARAVDAAAFMDFFIERSIALGKRLM